MPHEFVQSVVFDGVTPLDKITVLMSEFVIVVKLNDDTPVAADRSRVVLDV